METVKATALVAFTEFVEGYGQVHGDPDNKDKAAKNPLVPVTIARNLADSGKISLPKNFKAPGEEEDEAPVDDEKKDGGAPTS